MATLCDFVHSFWHISWYCPCSGLVSATILMLFHGWSTPLLCRWQVLKIVGSLHPGDNYYHCLLRLYWTFLTVWTLSWTKECFPQPLPTQFKRMQWKMFNINKKPLCHKCYYLNISSETFITMLKLAAWSHIFAWVFNFLQIEFSSEIALPKTMH